MNVRTPVFVYADDPVSQAGLEQLLARRARDLRRRVGQIDDARSPSSAARRSTTTRVRTIVGLQRDGCPHVLVVATRLDEEGILAASEAGTLGHAAPPRGDAGAPRPRRRPRRRGRGQRARPTSSAAARRRAPAAAGRRPGAVRRAGALSTREREVLRLLADGRDTAEIASTLCYSERTVKGVIHEITTRLQLRNRSHAVAFALRNELI